MNVVEEGRHLTGMIDERDVGIGCARGEAGNWRPNKTTLSALELHRHAVVHGSGLLWIDSGQRAGRRSQLARTLYKGEPQPSSGDHPMFIAMNRFRVTKGSEAEFERVWVSRDSHLDKVPGFVEFHLLKGPEADDHTLYASHTIWSNRAAFDAWTKSEAFRAAHERAGDHKPLYLGHPQFEGFEVRQTVAHGKAQVA